MAVAQECSNVLQDGSHNFLIEALVPLADPGFLIDQDQNRRVDRGLAQPVAAQGRRGPKNPGCKPGDFGGVTGEENPVVRTLVALAEPGQNGRLVDLRVNRDREKLEAAAPVKILVQLGKPA